MTHKVQRWGNSLAIRIPRSFARAVGLTERSAVQLRLENRRIVIEPILPSPTLDQLLAGMPVRLWAKWTSGRGDIVSACRSAAHRENALVLSPASYSAKTGLALVCPITDVAGPFTIGLPRGLPVHGAVLADRAQSLDVRSCGLRLVCSVPDGLVTAVLQRLAPLVEQTPDE